MEQRLLFRELFRVPLHPHAEARAGMLNCFDYLVFTLCGGDEPCAKTVHGLVVRNGNGFQCVSPQERDIPVAGAVEVLWSKCRWQCEEPAGARLSFSESTTQVPRRARSTGWLRTHVVDAMIRSGRAVSETAVAFGVSWWLVHAALSEACVLTLPDVNELGPRMLGIYEHRFRSVRFFLDPSPARGSGMSRG